MIFRLTPSSGVPVYLQLMGQVKHAVETGALQAGDQLPTIRKLAEDLVVNPNTVVRAYRELQHEGVIEVRHGSGAYISESRASSTRITRKDRMVVESAVERLSAAGLSEDEIRRLFEHALISLRHGVSKGGNHV
jgi:GntR family transcriptional regulator